MTLGKLFLWGFFISAPLTLLSAALADDGFYAGASIGGAAISEDRILIDDTSTAYKFYAGYQFNEFVSAEAGFINFDDVTDVVIINTASQRAVADGHGYSIAGVARLPLGRFAVTSKAGLLFWESESGTDMTAVDDTDGSDFLVGFGVQFRLSEQVSLALDYELYQFGHIDADVAFFGFRADF